MQPQFSPKIRQQTFPSLEEAFVIAPPPQDTVQAPLAQLQQLIFTILASKCHPPEDVTWCVPHTPSDTTGLPSDQLASKATSYLPVFLSFPMNLCSRTSILNGVPWPPRVLIYLLPAT